MANNVQLYNAAFSSFLGGAMQSQNGSIVSADYASIVAHATAFATQVDSLIVTDAAIATPLVAAGERKVHLLEQLCAGVQAGRSPNSSTAADYANVALQIFAAYTRGVTGLV